jgi:predicted aminopeptidase
MKNAVLLSRLAYVQHLNDFAALGERCAGDVARAVAALRSVAAAAGDPFAALAAAGCDP